MAEYVDSAVQTVLSSSRLKLAHPGNAKLTQVYPTPSEVTSVLAQAINHRGQFRVSTNNTAFGARSDFILSSSALISEMAISGVIRTVNSAAGLLVKPNAIGFAFDLIESIEITYSNSLMQNMFIRGETLKDYSILCCCSPREVCDLLEAAGNVLQVNGGANTVNDYPFTIPITFLNHKVGSLRNSWPVDGSVLAGPIQIAINWRTADHAFVKDNAAVGPMPVAFQSLELVAKTTQLQDASFSVKKAMMLDPQLVYSLPATYITSVDYSKAIGAIGEEIALNLSSAPSGMLEGILISIRPKTGVGADQWATPAAAGAGDINVKGGSCTLDSIRLEFGGQNLFHAKTHNEYLHWQRGAFGDNLTWCGKYFVEDEVFDPEGPGTSQLHHPIYFIPLVDDGRRTMKGHTNENLPSYGGSQLQLYLKPSAVQRAQMGVGAGPVGGIGAQIGAGDGTPVGVANAGINYQIWIGYIVSGLLEISQGTVDLQL